MSTEPTPAAPPGKPVPFDGLKVTNLTGATVTLIDVGDNVLATWESDGYLQTFPAVVYGYSRTAWSVHGEVTARVVAGGRSYFLGDRYPMGDVVIVKPEHIAHPTIRALCGDARIFCPGIPAQGPDGLPINGSGDKPFKKVQAFTPGQPVRHLTQLALS